MVDETTPPPIQLEFLSWSDWGESTTPWPLVWDGIPAGKYAFSGVTGSPYDFYIKVMPDPTFPETYAAANGGGALIVQIPPPPDVTGVSVSRPSGEYDPLTDDIWEIVGEQVHVFGNSSDLLPYKYIAVMKNDIMYDHFKTVQELDNFLNGDLDYIAVALVPRDSEFGEKYLTASFQSNSSATPTLSGDFWFQIYNDWNQVKVKIDELVSDTKAYLEWKAENETPEGSEGEPPVPNAGESSGFDSSTPEQTNETKTIDKGDFSLDKTVKNDDQDTLDKIEEEGGQSVVDSIREKFSSVNTETEDTRTVDEKAKDGDSVSIDEIRNL